MSGFDVRIADAARTRGLAIAGSLVLSALLLIALFLTRDGQERSPVPQRLSSDELTVSLSDTMGESRPATPLPVMARNIGNTSIFATACVACPAAVETVSATVPSGGTLAGVLGESGASGGDINRAIAALDGVFDVRYLRAGQNLTVYLGTPRDSEAEGDVDGSQLEGFSFRPDLDRSITVARSGDGRYYARQTMAEFDSELVRATGAITTNLYVDALAAGATDRIVVELAGILAYAVDFQRSIRAGDRFDVVFERYLDADGNVMRTGDILYVVFAGRGDPLEYYRFETEDGQVAYFNAEGQSAQRLLMMTPINGARLSSGFGSRRHPVLGYTRNHYGTDFAAPRGTPIYAAGYGVVERANRFGSFGNFIRIRHTNGFATQYAHLNGFARGVTAGARVQQGQVIGYVGTTGRSTGPHLHYEVEHNGTRVNPMSLDLPTGRTLEDDERDAFLAERNRIQEIRDNAASAAEVRDIPAARIVQSGESGAGAQ
tara:strand:+ start:811 stop:2277 length:1467 start_codon:yes stop_codon:yes gene_type:complete